MVDLIIEGAKVLDGSKEKGRVMDLALDQGRIIRMGSCQDKEARRRVKGQGLFVCPGFIDMHTHTDLVTFCSEEVHASRVDQGVTTDLSGQCGLGPAPYTKKLAPWKDYFSPVVGRAPGASWDWPTFGDFLSEIEARPHLHNQALLISHGAIRASVVGLDNVTITEEHLDKMASVLEEALAAGAFGASFGLSYLPGMYTETRELIRLAQVLADHDAIFMVHIRSHADGLHQAIDEMLDICRQTGVKMHISHLKSYGDRRYGVDADTILDWLRPVRKENLNVTFDEHPYRAGSTTLSQLLPPWMREGGGDQMIGRLKDPGCLAQVEDQLADEGYRVAGWDNFVAIAGWDKILISAVGDDKNKHWEQWTLAEMAKAKDTSPLKALAQLLVADRGKTAMIMLDIFSDEDLAQLMSSPLAMLGSDGITTGKPHPRLYGSFPLYLYKLVKKYQTLSWEEAIHRITALPAQRLGLKKRGLIRPGYVADLVLFDPDRLYIEEAYLGQAPRPEGILQVFVAGREADQAAGKLLRR